MTHAGRLFVGLALVGSLSSTTARAVSSGIDGFSGNPATGGLTCNECHTGGVAPTVTLSGPTQVEPGSTHTYTLTIHGGQEFGGGLDVSTSHGVLSAIDPGTWVRNDEIVQRFMAPADANGEVTWFLEWTAPPSHTTATLYGAGNSVNGAGGPNGDAASTDVLVVTVGALTPGETSGDGGDPLLVTSHDPVSGDLSLSYQTGCQATSNNVYYGPLDQVATPAWTGDVCDIGVSGVLDGFNPGPGSYFFVVVGTNGSSEGSYGLRRDPGGAVDERAPWGGHTCGQTQNLSNRCD